MDDEIKHRYVKLRHRETGKLSELMSLQTIIDSLPDRKKEFVELATEDPEPIVKIVNKKERYEKRKLAKKKAVAVSKKNSHKEVQLTWGSAEGDFTHKIGRAREELEKGSKVDLVFSHKKGQDPRTAEEMLEQLQGTVQMLVDVGREWKPQALKGKIGAVFLQGTASPDLGIMAEDLSPKRFRMNREEERQARKNKKQPENTLFETLQ